jgi:hypothetical protein
MKEDHKETPLRWFNDHPIVSTVLWILGHDMSKQQKRLESDGNKSPSLLSWKDDHGGHIAEYIQEVQGKTSATTDVTESDGSDYIQRLKLKNIDGTDNNCSVGEGDRGPENEKMASGEISAECTPSPQWGFYVPITPPDQEKFTKINEPNRTVESVKIKTSKSSNQF